MDKWSAGRRGPRSSRRAAGLLGVLALAAMAACASAQNVSHRGGGASLPEVLEQLRRQTGYRFHAGVAAQFEGVARDFQWEDRPLPLVLEEISRSFKVDFHAADTTGFFVVPQFRPPARELPVGPYRLRVERPEPADDEGGVRLTLAFAAPDDLEADRIAGLGPDLEALDNFGRSMLPPSAPPSRPLSGARTRLTEYWHRLTLSPRDRRVVRLRSLRGSLLLFRKVTPIRVEFPLDRGPVESQAQSEQGLEFHLEEYSHAGSEVTAETRLEWTAARNVVGRGISRTPLPYLVDDTGRVYRDDRLRVRRTPGERQVMKQSLRFEDVHGRPVKLVYEVLLREDPERAHPFSLAHLPLLQETDDRATREGGAFYVTNGGSLSLQVTDPQGRGREGELAVGLARKTAGGWSGWRWIEAATDPDGRVRIEGLQPGSYRVRQSFRLEPSGPLRPLRAPVAVVEILAGKPTALPPAVTE